MRMNVIDRSLAPKTHEGAPAARISALKELRRTTLTALLWENTFYEKGSVVAARVEQLVPQCKPEDVAKLAIEAREQMYLRHAPLFLVRQLARIKGQGPLVAETLARVIQRPDEMGEYLAMYWEGKQSTPRPSPVSAGSARGLRTAFGKFNAYQLAKYDRDGAIKLRDILRLVHPKPLNAEQATLWRKVLDRTLETPDTWEVALSGGADKKLAFERLLREKKLGALAFLRNLRNMIEAGVSSNLIRARFEQPLDKVLPFRYIAAERHAPQYSSELNTAMLRACSDEPRLSGETVVLVDVSGSMKDPLSKKSEMRRMDAAAGVAVLMREIADARVFTFSNRLVEVPARRGLPLVDAILGSQTHESTYLGRAFDALQARVSYDRIIVITDEQSHDRVNPPNGKGYMINVAPYKNGVGYGAWTHIDGFSERVLDFIREIER